MQKKKLLAEDETRVRMQGMTQSYNVYDSNSFKNTKPVKDKIHNDKDYSLAEEDKHILEMIKSA